MASKYEYRLCAVCAKGGIDFSRRNSKSPVASLLVQASTLLQEIRKQKTSGAFAMCADCIAKLLDGGPLPKEMREKLAQVFKLMGIEIQRSLPLAVKPSKKVKRSK